MGMTRVKTAALPESMLDLIWILLLYFLMISTVRTDRESQTVLVERVPYLDQGVDSVPTERKSALMTITASGEWSIDGERVDKESLPDQLRRLRSSREVSHLLVDVDRGARVEELLAVQDIAHASKLEFLIRRERPPAADSVTHAGR